MAGDARLQALEARLAARLQRSLDAALKSRIGEDPEWDAHLLSLGVKPMTAAQRLAHQQQAVAQTRGALPLELRRALQRVEEATRVELVELTGDGAPGLEGDEDENDRRLEAVQRSLDGLVEREVKAYLDRVRPAVTLAGIFANAQLTSLRMGGATETTSTLRCPCCGAARPKGTDLRECSYCGRELL